MKVKKTKKTTLKKKSNKKTEEPMVKVLNMNVNPDNPRNGFFELDLKYFDHHVIYLY